jgi:hypothetical protein
VIDVLGDVIGEIFEILQRVLLISCIVGVLKS